MEADVDHHIYEMVNRKRIVHEMADTSWDYETGGREKSSRRETCEAPSSTVAIGKVAFDTTTRVHLSSTLRNIIGDMSKKYHTTYAYFVSWGNSNLC